MKLYRTTSRSNNLEKINKHLLVFFRCIKSTVSRKGEEKVAMNTVFIAPIGCQYDLTAASRDV